MCVCEGVRVCVCACERVCAWQVSGAALCVAVWRLPVRVCEDVWDSVWTGGCRCSCRQVPMSPDASTSGDVHVYGAFESGVSSVQVYRRPGVAARPGHAGDAGPDRQRE